MHRLHVGEIAAAVRPRTGGGAVIGVERGFVLEEADGSLRHLPEVWADDGVRMNEGGCDPDGRFWCGSMAYDHARRGGALPPGSRPFGRVLTGVTTSNGLEWSPDGPLAYYNDTPTHDQRLRLRPTAASPGDARLPSATRAVLTG